MAEEAVSSCSCALIPEGGSHVRIDLRNKEVTVVGRGPLSTITDKKCPRNQVEITAVFDKKEVIVKQIGKSPSIVNGQLLQFGDSVTLGHSGWIELLEGKHRYSVNFIDKITESEEGKEVPEEDFMTEPPVKKRKTASIQTTLKIKDPVRPISSSSSPKKGIWKEIDSLLVFQFGNPPHSDKVAAFDVDNTIIETKSGKKFATGPSDWKLMHKVHEKLSTLVHQGFKIVFITNQLGISKGKPTKEEFKKKVEDVAFKLDIPLLLLAATAKDIYRKPCTGMWDHLVCHENESVAIDKKLSIYVGDAAGREAGWMSGKKKDFSCADRKFASNLQIKFLTPEEIFLKQLPTKKFNWGEFNPMNLDYSKPPLPPITISASEQELIVFVGCPASGKSKFFKSFMAPKGYCYVNRDTLGTWQKCVAKCRDYLKIGKSVVVDNTNPDRESRSRYTEVGKEFSIPMRCFQFTTSIAHAKHNNRFRELTMSEDDKHAKVNDMVYNMYKSKFVEPSADEGFSEIAKIDFIPTFSKKDHETLYKQFLE